MNLGLIAVLCILDVVFAVAVIYWTLSKKKSNADEKIEKIVDNSMVASTKETAPVIQPVVEEPVVAPIQPKEREELIEIDIPELVEEEPVEIEVPEEPVEEIEEIVAEPVADIEEEPVEEEGEEDSSKAPINRLSFAEKLLSLEPNISDYYNLIYNFFMTFRKINPRVSRSGVSFRFGRELIAKLTIRGKTMKLHLALDVNNYDEKIYFQKDVSDVKSYQEVPFTVKVKSERGMKRALELIAALTLEKGIERKTRYQEIDALEEIREKA